MSLPAVGIYMRLICHCWNEGSLPSDVAILARLSGASKRQMHDLWPSIVGCFKETDDGRLVHPRLEREREKQSTHRQRQTDKAEARWAMARKLEQKLASDHAAALPRHKSGIVPALPEPCSTSSSASSSASAEQKNVSSAASAEPTSPTVLTFHTQGPVATWPLTEAQIAKWQGVYPALDVLGVCRKAWGWCDANPHKRKTARGMPAFLNRWLGNEVDRLGTTAPRAVSGSPKPIGVASQIGRRAVVPDYEPL